MCVIKTNKHDNYNENEVNYNREKAKSDCTEEDGVRNYILSDYAYYLNSRKDFKRCVKMYLISSGVAKDSLEYLMLMTDAMCGFERDFKWGLKG